MQRGCDWVWVLVAQARVVVYVLNMVLVRVWKFCSSPIPTLVTYVNWSSETVYVTVSFPSTQLPWTAVTVSVWRGTVRVVTIPLVSIVVVKTGKVTVNTVRGPVRPELDD